jgi:WD40 repeat protein
VSTSIACERDSEAVTVALRTARIVIPHALGQTPVPAPGRTPHRLGNYEIRKELGRGGMGIVYEGFDPNLRRTVAVKVLKDSRDEEFLQRFRTEAEAVAQLQHPNIVHVFEVGWQDGVPFVALEYLPGGSLHQRIGGKPKPPEVAAAYARDLASAAAHAHRHGVLHRDLKPANVLFTETDQLKITDFGAARLMPFGDTPQDPGLTRMGEVIGTPQYMAPEQASGVQSDIGPAADVYSVGAILYEMLTGRPPFTGLDPYDVIHQVRTQDPVPPRKLQPKVPKDLETICLKCLEKDPRRRYGSALDLHNDLNRYLAGDAIQAKSPGFIRLVMIRAKRRPAATGLTIGMIVAGLIGLTAFAWQFRKTFTALDEAERNYRTAVSKSAEAEIARKETEKQKAEALDHLKEANKNLYQNAISRSQLFSDQGKFREAADVLEAAPEDLRSWEWHMQRRMTSDVLWKNAMRERKPEAGISWIYFLELSPDGTRVAAGFVDPYEHPGSGADQNPSHIGIFRVADGMLLHWMPKVFSHRMTAMQWLDDSTILLADYLGNIRSVDVVRQRVVAEWPFVSPHKNDFSGVEFSKFRNVIVRIGYLDNRVMEVIDPWRRRPTERIPLRTASGLRPSSPDGRFIALSEQGVNGCDLVVFDLATKSYGLEFAGALGAPCFSRDGRFVTLTASHRSNNPDVRWRRGADAKWEAWNPNAGSRPACMVGLFDMATRSPAWVRHHPANVAGWVGVSPDDRRIIVYNDDTNTIVNYDTATGSESTSMRGHDSVIRDLSFSPNGQYILTASDDRTVRVWDAATGAQILTYRGHDHCVRRAIFSDDGRRIISGGADETLDCLDLSRPRLAGGIMPPHHTGGEGTTIGTIHFKPNGRLLVLNNCMGITEFEPCSGNPVRYIPLERISQKHNKEITDFAFNSAGTHVAGRLKGRVGPRMRNGKLENEVLDSDIAIWNCETGRLEKSIVTPLSILHTVALSPDGQLVLGTGWAFNERKEPQAMLVAYDAITGNERFRHIGRSIIPAIAFAPDGSEFCVGYNRHRKDPGPTIAIFACDGTLLVEVPTFADVEPEDPRFAMVNALAYSPDGKKIGGVNWAANGTFCIDRKTQVRDWANQILAPVTSVAFSADNRRMVTTGYDDIVQILDVASGSVVAQLKGSVGRINDFAFPGQIRFSQDGRSLAATHWNGHFSIWHVDHLGVDPIDPKRLRTLADNAAFRFHLYSANEAFRANDDFAFRIQLDRLLRSEPPTPALAADWKNLLDRVAPKKIAVAAVGGWACDWNVEMAVPWPETAVRWIVDRTQAALKTRPK